MVVKGLFWLFYLSFGITLNSALTITDYVNFYDETEKKPSCIMIELLFFCVFNEKCMCINLILAAFSKNKDNILASFVYISLYSVFLLFYTLVTRTDLV